MNKFARLGLGTVQFGQEYGISNSNGLVSTDIAQRMIEKAAEVGVGYLDTAPAYGTSEIILGQILPAKQPFKIITKTPSISESTVTERTVQNIYKVFMQSLERLKQPQVYGLLLHHGRDFLKPGGERIIRLFKDLKDQGLTQKVGFSTYNSVELDLIQKLFTPDIVQIPSSIIDQRLISSGHVAELRQRGIEVHARSLFLQGALLMTPDTLPPMLAPVNNYLKQILHAHRKSNISALEICLKYGFNQEDLSALMIGATSEVELSQIFHAVQNLKNIEIEDMSSYALNDERIVNPSNWSI